jgi:Zn-dependent protease
MQTWFIAAVGAVFAILSLLTAGGGIKPRYELKPIGVFDRFAIGAALLAVFAIHGFGLIWAVSKIA